MTTLKIYSQAIWLTLMIIIIASSLVVIHLSSAATNIITIEIIVYIAIAFWLEILINAIDQKYMIEYTFVKIQ